MVTWTVSVGLEVCTKKKKVLQKKTTGMQGQKGYIRSLLTLICYVYFWSDIGAFSFSPYLMMLLAICSAL